MNHQVDTNALPIIPKPIWWTNDMWVWEKLDTPLQAYTHFHGKSEWPGVMGSLKDTHFWVERRESDFIVQHPGQNHYDTPNQDAFYDWINQKIRELHDPFTPPSQIEKFLDCHKIWEDIHDQIANANTITEEEKAEHQQYVEYMKDTPRSSVRDYLEWIRQLNNERSE